MKWSAPQDRGQISLVIFVFSVLLFVSLHEASATPLKCELVDTETNEILEELSLNIGESKKFSTLDKNLGFPKELKVSVDFNKHTVVVKSIPREVSFQLVESDDLVVKKFPAIGYAVECEKGIGVNLVQKKKRKEKFQKKSVVLQSFQESKEKI